MSSKRDCPDAGVAPPAERAAKATKLDDEDNPGKSTNVPANFSGSSFVVTGEFDMGRPAADALITKLGGKLVSSVAKSTSYLLLGKPGVGEYNRKTGPGTTKHKKAKQFNISIVDEEWLIAQSGQDAASISDLFHRVLETKKALGIEEDVAPGATDEQIAAAETRLGYSLNTQIKELYKLSDGGLMWEKIDSFNNGNGYCPFVNFYAALRMVGVDEYVHVAGSGVVFEWDVSFDGQCGNTIIAGSVAELLENWAESLEADLARKKAGNPDDSSANRYWRGNFEDEVEIDKSEPQKDFFRSFKRAYERSFGSWPQYVS